MTPAEMHAAVLAALAAAEQAEQDASPAPWQWERRGDKHGNRDVLFDGTGDTVTEVWWDGDRAGLIVGGEDQTLIAALRNTAAAVYAGVREILNGHQPTGDNGPHGWHACATCRRHDKYDGWEEVRWMCPTYRAAARMIPNLPAELAELVQETP